MAAIDLCTREDVQLVRGLTPGADEQVDLFITTASRRILRHAGREFVSEVSGNVARTFAYRGEPIFDLGPYDLRADLPVTVSLDGETLTTDEDFYLEPLPATEGVYERLDFRGSRFGRHWPWRGAVRARLEVTGTWGFATVPEDVKMAAIRTVVAWLDRGAPSADFGISGDEPRSFVSGDSSFDLPLIAKRLLAPFRRPGIG